MSEGNWHRRFWFLWVTHTGIAISLMLPPADARELALTRPVQHPAAELHLTLAYLGQVPNVQGGRSQ